MNPARQRRIWMILLVLLGAGVATALALTALNQNIQHFFSPSDIAQGKAPIERTFRLGGLVEEGSIERVGEGLTVRFVVTDRFRLQPAEFTGILPDLFREGQSVVAVGRMREGVFVADEVLAKHDENYMPAEVADAIARARTKQAAETAAGSEATEPPAPPPAESRSY
jgi:cytochrome c-type biogenesis protein CcmE